MPYAILTSLTRQAKLDAVLIAFIYHPSIDLLSYHKDILQQRSTMIDISRFKSHNNVESFVEREVYHQSNT